MPAQPNLKSTAITNLDASPILRATAGQEGGLTHTFEITGVVGPTTDTDTTGGILRAVRIPSNAIVKQVLVAQKAATTTASFDVSLYFSDSTNDGTIPTNQGLVSKSQFFAAAVDTHAAVNWTDVTFTAGNYQVTDSVNPIWKAAAAKDGAGNVMTQDPGGFFDITLDNKATISGAATLAVRVIYVVAAS